ncbi:hypothetical protein EGW08_000410 [Elysia chlorotica]|uniref:Uncharacterized protein n=1 Tax=Elysia chlorotica TaxID=188477 RepID=A0A433UDH4_ELYCH|nr:hypothetical protein EGW08_000410 [Elysia chlorotica]
MMCLMSDRDANMKLFNKKMLQYTRDLLGSDSTIEFLHCNAHFLVAMADATEKGLKYQESAIVEKLGRDKNSAFHRFSSCNETAVCKIIRTASDVFGPRGERLFGDLDYSMVKRRTASIYLHSTVNMWKHNGTTTISKIKSSSERRAILESAKKNAKKLKLKNKAAVKAPRDAVKRKTELNERKKKEKEIDDKDRQAALLTYLLSQGGLCHTKEELDALMSGPQPLQRLKVEMRFRKYYMKASELRLTGKF